MSPKETQPSSESPQLPMRSVPQKPRGSKTKRKATENEDSGSEADAQPSPSKTVKKPRIALHSEEGSEDARTRLLTNNDGEQYVDLGKKKRVTVRTFKGMTLVDIREYYGTDGDEKPGKKGISLTVEQWGSLMQASSAISGLL